MMMPLCTLRDFWAVGSPTRLGEGRGGGGGWVELNLFGPGGMGGGWRGGLLGRTRGKNSARSQMPRRGVSRLRGSDWVSRAALSLQKQCLRDSGHGGSTSRANATAVMKDMREEPGADVYSFEREREVPRVSAPDGCIARGAWHSSGFRSDARQK